MLRVKSDEAGIKAAAEAIKNGKIAAIPTETVFGLAADAFNAEAVRAVYATKGRPGDNPLILHVADKEKITEIAESLPDYARKLMDAFWPGPLTLVVRKKPGLPGWLGGFPDNTVDTVGVRMPSHPVMLAVIKASGCVIAAPSANKAGRPSPTRTSHVLTDYENTSPAPDIVMEAELSEVGIESTVVDVTGNVPVILRPGAVTAEILEKTVGKVNQTPDATKNDAPRAPGMKYRHYAPAAPMTLLSGNAEAIASYITTQIVSDVNVFIGALVTPDVRERIDRKWNVMAIQGDSDSVYTPLVSIRTIGKTDDMPGIARDLYDHFRTFDELGVDVILTEALPTEGMGAAIMDRMTKAAEGRVLRLGAVPQ